MNKLTRILNTRWITPKKALMPPLMLMLIWLNLSGCKEIVLIRADQTETFMKSNQVFTATCDGVFMSAGRYQRYRRIVADRIQEDSGTRQ